MSISHLKPSALWQQFQALCDIPRPSKHEQQVVEYVMSFTKTLGLDPKIDSVGNVIIKKPATSGNENLKTVVLQSHLDMVPQKNEDTVHDFKTDPIHAYVDGDWVTAEGTTLGADNGIGVAAILALLASSDIPHGPLEALLTIDEEAGMTGAAGLQPGWFDGEILFNLDTEDDGELYIGCAGGVDANISLSYDSEPVPIGSKAFMLSVTGLKGGHSGVDIHLNRGNANKITNRFLHTALKSLDISVASFNGGSLRNAIPREAFTCLCVPEPQAEQLQSFLSEFSEIIKKELAVVEPNLSLSLSNCDTPKICMPKGILSQWLNAIYACPNGVSRMSDELVGVVETSNNLARVYSDENTLYCQCLIRSAIETAKEDMASMIASTFSLIGAEVDICNGYPGWQPNSNSEILTRLLALHEKRYGTKAEIKVIHAGLECGLLGAAYPHWDMISFGPTIRCAHSPDEKILISTVEKFWDFLTAGLMAVPHK